MLDIGKASRNGMPLKHFYDEETGIIRYDADPLLLDKLVIYSYRITHDWVYGLIEDLSEALGCGKIEITLNDDSGGEMELFSDRVRPN
jgi:hypothetical protein